MSECKINTKTFCDLKCFCIFDKSIRKTKSIKINQQPINQQVMTNSVQKIVKGNQMLTSVAKQMDEFTNSRSYQIVRYFQEKGMTFSNDMEKIKFREEIETSLCFDFLRAFSGYCLKTDVVTITSNTKNAKGFNVLATVERNGETFHIEARLIEAGGYNVQRFHYRYIVNTSLPTTENLFVVAEKKLKAIESAILKFRDLSNAITRMKVDLYGKEMLEDKRGANWVRKDIKTTTEQLDKVILQIEELRK